MSEEMYATILPNGGTYRCVKSQLDKTGGHCPIWGVPVEGKTKKEVFEAIKLKAKGTPAEAILSKFGV